MPWSKELVIAVTDVTTEGNSGAKMCDGQPNLMVTGDTGPCYELVKSLDIR